MYILIIGLIISIIIIGMALTDHLAGDEASNFAITVIFMVVAIFCSISIIACL